MTAAPRWHREGLLVAAQAGHPWWVSHAQLPTVLALSDRLWRIYFGARDRDNRTRVLAVDLDPTDRMRVVAEHFEALLDRGPLGAFDHEGVCPSAAIIVDDEVRLYYIGVAVRRDVRTQAAIGVCISDDGLAFRRVLAGPALGTGPYDPYFVTAPTVRPSRGGYCMCYVGGTQWRPAGRLIEPFYELRLARSGDGLVWDPRTETFLPLGGPDEAGLGRPWFADRADGLRLWFSRRGEAYRGPGEGAYRLVSIGIDAAGRLSGRAEPVVFQNPPAPGDFDGWMQAYACVVPYGDDLIMIYNGDDFGRTGFGWARLPGGARGRE
jgi:hypothetical protein